MQHKTPDCGPDCAPVGGRSARWCSAVQHAPGLPGTCKGCQPRISHMLCFCLCRKLRHRVMPDPAKPLGTARNPSNPPYGTFTDAETSKAAYEAQVGVLLQSRPCSGTSVAHSLACSCAEQCASAASASAESSGSTYDSQVGIWGLTWLLPKPDLCDRMPMRVVGLVVRVHMGAGRSPGQRRSGEGQEGSGLPAPCSLQAGAPPGAPVYCL